MLFASSKCSVGQSVQQRTRAAHSLRRTEVLSSLIRPSRVTIKFELFMPRGTIPCARASAAAICGRYRIAVRQSNPGTFHVRMFPNSLDELGSDGFSNLDLKILRNFDILSEKRLRAQAGPPAVKPNSFLTCGGPRCRQP